MGDKMAEIAGISGGRTQGLGKNGRVGRRYLPPLRREDGLKKAVNCADEIELPKNAL